MFNLTSLKKMFPLDFWSSNSLTFFRPSLLLKYYYFHKIFCWFFVIVFVYLVEQFLSFLWKKAGFFLISLAVFENIKNCFKNTTMHLTQKSPPHAESFQE